MYAAIQNIIDRARFELPGATDATINVALFDAFDEWARRTDANRFVAEIPLIAGIQTYTITFTNTLVVRVWSIAHRDMTVYGYYDADDGKLVLTRVPTADDVADPLMLEVSMAAKPGVDDPDLWMSELLWGRYRSVLLDGVIAKMASQVAKPYSNQTKAMFHGRRFHNGMAATKAQSDTGNAAMGQAWSFPVIK